ncbi:type II toxin-antitoxin system VapC family toxin [Cyanobium sp. BA20m-p-22]|uniref:type II toxin-antitoxin system VapC family toxin n=1 Tax=Cyanobium sp. BA20m-p-22 TaxID=2823704 RepID=UPI0020CB8EA3|nr:type II toxin-antitoxin system VapC family toxin [Cyanobium sp. BA20m-p-22]MCP9909602.1 type II toxin-antitoxin system VapC family toxin [Cyanobium sp. BA20m-p-22]
MIVVDTNVLAYLLLPGPKTSLAEALLLDQPRWAAPPLWRSEWRNVLTTYLRRDLLQLSEAVALMQHAEVLLAGQDEPVASDQVLQLANSSRCSAYDCEFVAAALQLGVPLVTDDRAVLAAFPDVARPLV